MKHERDRSQVPFRAICFMRVLIIIPSAGSGSRFGGATPKQYLELDGKPVIERVVERFLRVPGVEQVVVPVAADHLAGLKLSPLASDPRVMVVAGGATRQQSVTLALEAVPAAAFDVVAVHDAVRPFFRSRTVASLLEAAMEFGASLPALPVNDTIHVVEGGRIVQLLDRSRLMAAQTPQCFRIDLLRSLLERAALEGVDGTDEAGLAVRFGLEVRVLPGDATNFKITQPQDWDAALRLLHEWSDE